MCRSCAVSAYRGGTKVSYLISAVVVMALVTYIPRVLPLVLFRKEIKSRFLKSVLFYIPYAVLGALTFPAIFYVTKDVATASAATAAAVILSYFEQSLVVVAIAAIATAYIFGIFM